MSKRTASNTLELPYYRGIGRQRGRGFEALAQVFGKNVTAAKRVGADLFEFAVAEVADVVSGNKKFETAAKSVGRETLRKQFGGGKQKRSIPVKNLKRSSPSRRDIFTNIAK